MLISYQQARTFTNPLFVAKQFPYSFGIRRIRLSLEPNIYALCLP